MPAYRLTLEYEGTEFHGWQFQPNTRTVEGTLRDAVHAVTGETLDRTTAAGRTDSGAHAHGQVVGFTLSRAWQPAQLGAALNAALPADVVVVDSAVAPAEFHARRDAHSRTYRYLVTPRAERAAVTRRHTWTVRGPLDIDAMRRAATLLVGTHDFAAFGAPTSTGGTTVRTVHEASVRLVALSTGGDAHQAVVVISVRANAFLRGMMRAFAGALVAVGQGRQTIDQIAALLDAPAARVDRLTVAPAHGLHQWSVSYAPVTGAAPV
jgi:tRNA pseudouridine38-40 synthase